jgi:diaminohydroxyphosphoribosylaminopyrimidine deaminase/5-amino-6-(5-phosphoribosylamino)uracil reductase
LLPPDEIFLLRCAELAHRPGAAVEPNPRVGAVLVYNGRILSEGWHARFGGPHAEVVCLDSVKESDRALLRQSTLYVSLEPCSHHGKTPPCADRIVREGIGRVVVGAIDPNPTVAGNGIDRLRKAGVEVKVAPTDSTAARACDALLAHFRVNQTLQRPYITLKWAQTADGFMGLSNGDRLQISGPLAARLTHAARAEHQAILVGARTALADDPRLDARLAPGPAPLRLILTNSTPLPASLRMLHDGGSPVVAIAPKSYSPPAGMGHWVPPTDSLPEILHWLYAQHQIGSIWVEGGPQVLRSLLDADFWDEIWQFRNPILYAGDIPAPKLPTSSGVILQNAIGEDSWLRILRA